MNGVPMSHVDYKTWQCRPVEFKKSSCRMSLKPKKGPCRRVGLYPQTSGKIVKFFGGVSNMPNYLESSIR